MNLKELNSFKLSDAVVFHDELNPLLWENGHLLPEVKNQLLLIADDFLSELGISDLKVKDITVSGSNAAYSYTPHSDLDLHILVDMSKLSDNEIYKELFDAKKNLYNDSHDITVHGIPVELYVQDSNLPVVSIGEYSLKDDSWLRLPTKRRANFDQNSSRSKYEKLIDLVEIGLRSNNINKVNHLLKTIKRYRQAGLDKGGEFGPENLAYKALRSQGYIDKLYALRNKLHSEELTIEDYDPNGIPPGPETKPTMPKGTVRVDVSDVYDWYKLGQNISNLTRADKSIFGKGPPSTIMSFGSEPEEHKYINNLKKLGLDTTDIDPLDPNQPKNMPRQKVDPTYNVQEASDDQIHNYRKLDKILNKLCEIIVNGQQSDKNYGMVAACVLDTDNNVVARTSKNINGKWIHAERNAIEAYENKYGSVPKGSIVITTLSPCNELHDKTASERAGVSCTDYLNSKKIKKVYCGYMDPTQDNDSREFNILETYNKDIRARCKEFADTFLTNEDSSMQFASEKTPVISPYSGIKDNQYRGSIGESSENHEAAEAYETYLRKTLPHMMGFLAKSVKGWSPSKQEMMGAINIAVEVMKQTGDVKVAGKAMMDELNTLHRKSQGVAEGGAETSWSYGTEKITLQDILELTKDIKPINLPINDNLKSKLLHWDGNPEEIERINQVTVSNQFPILIIVDEQGEINYILDGNHRLHKAIRSQAKTIPAKLIKPSNLNDKAKKILHIKEQGVPEKNVNEKVNQDVFKRGFEKTKPFGKYTMVATPGRFLLHQKFNEPSEQFTIKVFAGKNQVGWVNFEIKDDHIEALDLHVDAKHRRRGIATAMYKFAKELGNDISPSSKQTALGKSFWATKSPVDESIDVNEAFDQPYKIKWEKSEYGDWDALAQLDDGTYLSIMFNQEQGDDGEEATQVEFHRANSQEITGQGDAQRVFATVLTAIQQYIKKQKPLKLTFSATKEVDPDQNSESRAKLYDRLVQRYARSWGYRAFRADTGKLVIYQLSRIKPKVAEASGYIPSEEEKNDPRFKTALTVDVHPNTMKKDAKRFGNKISRAGIPPTLNANGKF